MTAAVEDGAAYRDPNRPVESRVEDLLGRMTLDEKLAQLGGVWMSQLADDTWFSEARAATRLSHGTGHVTRVSGATGLLADRTAAFADAVQRFLVERTRLGIPAIVHEESTAGLLARGATQFPQAIGLAATWDPELVEEMAGVIRTQMLAVGARQALAPVLDVARDPRWGRVEETYGEDPYLVARMGVAYVRGLQTDDLARGVACTGKHFLAYGLPEGGLNHAPVHTGPRELREVYAAPFRAAIHEAGLASVMNSYSEVDGLPCGGSAEILDGLLRGELAFTGVVSSDYFTTMLLVVHHAVAVDEGQAGQRALEAGLDVELPVLSAYGTPLRERVEQGAVPPELVDRSVRRVLRLKLELGLFEHPYVDAGAAPAVFDTSEQRTLARALARRSVVLLRNEGGLLPLDPGIGSIAVIGPSADDARLLLGDYSYPAHVEIAFGRAGAGGDGDILPSAAGALAPGPYYNEIVTLLDGIRAAVSPETDLRVARGCDVTGNDAGGIAGALDAARAAAVAVVAVGGKSGLTPSCTVGEMRDAADLGLPGLQQRLVEEVVATGTPTVVVLVSGRVHAIGWIAEHVPAIVAAWLPGEEGGAAVADVLFGVVSPAGRLPVSMPRSVGQVPVYHGHKPGGGRSQIYGDYTDSPTTALFPFGHGLSYTTFGYGALTVAPVEPTTDATLVVSCAVTNTGPVGGDEVVQLYLRDEVASVTRPVRELAGFRRMHLEPGEARRVSFGVDVGRLAFYDERMRFLVEPGTVKVMVGGSSADIRLEATVALGGDAREVDPNSVRPTTVEVE
jgi:beta-glucosidase